ncbi:MAG: RidA family protein [Spirochaetaceae bacterium]|nr:MAG: RidA family protein [Spirochaetaceae bacterium]
MEAYEKKIISHPAKSNLPFSPAVGCGPFVFISGSVGRDPASGEIAKGDVGSQTRRTMQNIAVHLQKAGSGFQHALKATIFITDMSLYADMNAAYGSFFSGDPPARSCVEVSRLPDPDALVEIELIALHP